MDESTQEGEATACGLIKEAVLRQMLQHLLAVHSDESGEDAILFAEEQLETLQALLEAATPLTRNVGGPREVPATMPEEEEAPGADQYGSMNVSRPTGDSDGGHQEALHVAQFIRRHRPGDALRIAASVLFATVGVIETQTGRNDETQLIRTIATEIHTIARQLLHQPDLQDEGDNLRQGTKRLLSGEIAQWEQHVQDEEQEAEEMAMSLAETGEETPQTNEGGSPASSADSHRRRRELAARHKEFVGEDPPQHG